VKSKLGSGAGRAESLAKSDKTPEQRIEEIYAVAFARKPTAEELSTSVGYLAEVRKDANGNPIDPAKALRENLQDLLWALINAKEFLFNH
jgi:hypothetical protein